MKLQQNTLERTARVLSSQFGIRVIFKDGIVPHTNGKEIWLPRIPETASAELIDAMQGYLDHETGHVLFTEFGVWKSALPEDAEKVMESQFYMCLNYVEDTRIEKRMIDTFPGSEYNLMNAHIHVSKKNRERWNREETEDMPSMSDFDKILLGFFMESRFPGSTFFQEVVDEKYHDKINHCLKLSRKTKIQSTKDASVVAKEIYEYLKDEADKDTKEKEAWRKKYNKDSGASSSQVHQALFEDLAEDIAKQIQEHVPSDGDYTHHNQKQEYKIYSTESDVLQVCPTGSGDTVSLLSLRQEGNECAGLVRMRLLNCLKSILYRKWQGGKIEGRLDSARLHKVLHGDTAVFKLRSKRVEMDVAVGLAMDHSYSMAWNRKINIATSCAIILGDVLDSLSVPFMAYGYSTKSLSFAPPNPEGYARYCGHWLKVYKMFRQQWAAQASALAEAPKNIQANTLDGESVLFGVQQLLERPEQRKILFVFTDGYPEPGYGNTIACQSHLKDVVDEASKLGVEIVAFGIHTDSVHHYYKDYVLIEDLSDLVAEPLNKLESILRRQLWK